MGKRISSFKQLLTKYLFFMKLPKISHAKIVLFKRMIEPFYTNGFYPINFMAGTCKGSTFSFLPVFELLTLVLLGVFFFKHVFPKEGVGYTNILFFTIPFTLNLYTINM